MGRCEQFSKCDDLSKLYAQKKNWTTTQVTFINASKCGFLDEDLVCCSLLLSVENSNDFCVE